MEEVETGKLAMDKAQNAKVKEFAKRLVEDHTKANAELTKLASAKGVTPPGRRGRQSPAQARAHGEEVPGADFDREFMNDMLNDHQKVVREFRLDREIREGPGPEGVRSQPRCPRSSSTCKWRRRPMKASGRVKKRQALRARRRAAAARARRAARARPARRNRPQPRAEHGRDDRNRRPRHRDAGRLHAGHGNATPRPPASPSIEVTPAK